MLIDQSGSLMFKSVELNLVAISGNYKTVNNTGAATFASSKQTNLAKII